MKFLRNLSPRAPLFRSSRLLRYLTAGGTAAAVNLFTLYVLTEYVRVWYMASAVVALTLGFATSFVLQKFWTFQNMPLERVHIQLFQHIILSLANVVINLLLLYVMVEYFLMWYMLAQFISAGILAVANYSIYRTYIFFE